MSLSKLRSDYRNSEEFENGRPSGSRGMPIACRVCNMIFFDNVSLVLHFECHVEEGFRLHGRDLEPLRSDQHSSASWSPCSYSDWARVFSRMNDCLKSRPLPVPSPAATNRTPRDPNHLYIPVLDVSQPIHPIMGQYGDAPSSSCPLMYSQMGARNSVYGSAPAPHLRAQNGRPARFPVPKNQEIIVLSDDEEDENKSTAEIDLTLKL